MLHSRPIQRKWLFPGESDLNKITILEPAREEAIANIRPSPHRFFAPTYGKTLPCRVTVTLNLIPLPTRLFEMERNTIQTPSNAFWCSSVGLYLQLSENCWGNFVVPNRNANWEARQSCLRTCPGITGQKFAKVNSFFYRSDAIKN